MGVVGGVQHQGPIESAGAILAESSCADGPYDGLQILENQVGEQPVAELLAHFDEVLRIGNRSEFAGEVLHILKIAIAGARGSFVSAFEKQEAAHAQALALHLVADAGEVGEVHVGVAGIPALRFEIGVLAQRQGDGLALRFAY